MASSQTLIPTGENQYDDEDMERLRRQERGVTAAEDGAPTDAVDMSGIDPTADPDYVAPAGKAGGTAAGAPNSASNLEQTALGNQPGLDAEDGFYTGGGGKGRKRRKFWTRRRAMAGGTIAGFFVGGGILLSPFVMGPLEFIHFAQSLSGPHFGISERASTRNITRFYKFITGRGTSTCTAKNCLVQDGGKGDTRLNFLERKYNKVIFKNIESKGFKMWTDSRTQTFKGWRIDTSSKNSPFKGMNESMIEDALKAYGVKKADIKKVGGTGGYWIKNEALFKRGQTRLVMAMLQESGYSKVGSWIRARQLCKFAGCGFHPLKILDEKLNDKLDKGLKKLKEEYEKSRRASITGTEASGATIDTTNTEEQTTGEDGERTNQSVDESLKTTKTTTSPTAISDFMKSFAARPSTKISANVLDVVGYACLAANIYKAAGDINFDQTVMPAIRLATEQIATGSQIEASSLIDGTFNSTSLELAHEYLEAKDSSGKTTSWSDAANIRQNNGLSGGTDISSDKKEILSNPGKGPSWLEWTEPMVDFCSNQAIQATMGVLSIGIGVLSGGMVSTIVGAVVGYFAAPAALNLIAQSVAGNALDIAGVKGIEMGQYADFGAFFGANLARQMRGGRILSSASALKLAQDNMDTKNEEFASQSIAYKLFNAYDSKSLISRVVDTQSTYATENIASTINNFLGIGTSTLSTIGGLFSKKSSAATTMYDYSIPMVGFSLEEQENPLTENPYENAAIVGAFLDTPASSSLKDRALRCNGVEFYKDDQFGWSIRSIADPNAGAENNVFQKYVTGHLDSDCGTDPVIAAADSDATVATGTGYVAAAEDDMWTRMRKFIDDLSEFESYTCLMADDETSCDNSGFGATTAASSSTVNTDDLYKDSTSISCDTRTKDLGTQEVQHESSTFKIRVCGIKEIPSSGQESTKGNQYYIEGADGMTIVNSRVSTIFMNLAEDATANNTKLSSSSSFRMHSHQQDLWNANPDPEAVGPPGKSNHEVGIAVDFNTGGSKKSGASCDARATSSSAMWKYLNGSSGEPGAQKFGIYQYAVEPWHWDASPTRCKEPL